MSTPKHAPQSYHAPVLVIAGPTASGKSGLALRLADQFGGTIINADSIQLYDALPVLSARPDTAALKAVPHLLYGSLPPACGGNVATWCDQALTAIRETLAANRLPIVTGGTGLYIKALMDGLSDIPAVPDSARQAASDLRTQLGAHAFHAELARHDPQSAAKIPPENTQRVLRAYAVFLATGKSLSEWHAATQPEAPAGLSFRPILLAPPRRDLDTAGKARFETMLAHGALAEVEALLAQNPDQNWPVWTTLGARPLADYLKGKETLAAASDQAILDTRHYAKRQTTWFRHQLAGQHPETHILTEAPHNQNDPIFQIVQDFLKVKEGCGVPDVI
jgi:tRNA dimethylallyltransferase